jgi:hypothetical protein
MVVRFRSLAPIAFLAAPALASASELLPAVQYPSFNCNSAAAGGNVEWGNGSLILSPQLTFSNSDGSSANTLPMSCSDNKFSDSLDKYRQGDESLNYLKISMDQVFLDSSLKIDSENPFDIKYSTELKLDDQEQKLFSSFWDVTVLFHKYNVDGAIIGDYKEFIGFEIDSGLKFVDDASLKYENGQIVFDPTNPTGA